jgi:hypothetical protein
LFSSFDSRKDISSSLAFSSSLRWLTAEGDFARIFAPELWIVVELRVERVDRKFCGLSCFFGVAMTRTGELTPPRTGDVLRRGSCDS